MAAGTYNFTLEQGSTFSKIITYKDSLGQPVDLTDVSVARSQMRPTIASETVKNFVVAVHGDPLDGKISWTMGADVTATISTPSTWYYDLEIEYDDGTVKRLLQGTITLSLEVTR